MHHQERIDLNDSAMSAAIKLAEGNPGAITAIVKMMEEAPAIDPDSAWGSFGPLIALDSAGIYGSHIWMLWKDVCGQSAVNAETLFRASQLGIISQSSVRDAASEGRHSFDFPALLAKVREELPNFAASASVAV
jgi:hypothetical protein